MVYLTLSIDGTPDARARAAIDDAAGRQGGAATWRVHPAIGRSYALLEMPDAYDRAALGAVADGVLYETAVIALAVSPTVPQALPAVTDALAGAGRPAGMRACRPWEGGVILEWDPAVSSADVVLNVIDLELRRFSAGRTAEVLSPLPAGTVTEIAARGLGAPEIGTRRVLELLIDDA